MTTCMIKPMSAGIRAIKKKIFRPMTPPVFMDVGPEGLSVEDVELALELFNLLDDDSREWWGGDVRLWRLIALRDELAQK